MKNIMDSVNKHYSDNLDYVGKNATLQNAMKLADSDLKTFEEKGNKEQCRVEWWFHSSIVHVKK